MYFGLYFLLEVSSYIARVVGNIGGLGEWGDRVKAGSVMENGSSSVERGAHQSAHQRTV